MEHSVRKTLLHFFVVVVHRAIVKSQDPYLKYRACFMNRQGGSKYLLMKRREKKPPMSDIVSWLRQICCIRKMFSLNAYKLASLKKIYSAYMCRSFPQRLFSIKIEHVA